jgi:spore maturation protein CgeB
MGKPVILVVGKGHSIVHWLENTFDGVVRSGYVATKWSIRGNNPLEMAALNLAKLRGEDSWLALLEGLFSRVLKQVQPWGILFVSAFAVPQRLFEVAAEVAPSSPRIGWVGDRFDASPLAAAMLLDRIYYTDSSFLENARALGFPEHGSYLPLAVNESLFTLTNIRRSQGVVFVANHTPFREAVLRSMETSISIYGPSWKRMGHNQHKVHIERVAMRRVPPLYQSAQGVLNIRNESNVSAGLNQRSFEALACATPVLQDDLPDLARCFAPEEGILVYRSAEELNELHSKLLRDTPFAQRVGRAGYQRVVAEHTFCHRARAILRPLD